MTAIADVLEPMLPELVALRHDLHMHPELGFEEHRTAARVLEHLRRTGGLDIRTNVAGTGIVATLNKGKPGPCVALRADMDALPIQEENTFEHRSRHEERMHACGHDGHTACLVGAARVLASMADELPGAVKFIFQPAEEGGGGGERMIAEGALDDPPVDAAFALHGWPEIRQGQVIVGAGPILAATSTFDIELTGSGGHAAYPHQTQDLIVAAAHLVTAAQALASRLSDPVEPVAVSITGVQMGTAYNVLPARGRLFGTLRAMSVDTNHRLRDGLKRIAETTAAMFGAAAAFDWHPGYPPTINDPALAEAATRAAREVFGADGVISDSHPSMGGEDFSYFGQRVPAVMVRLGVCPPDRTTYPKLHHPRYDFPDAAIPLGAALHCRLAVEFLKTQSA
ncbi:MAG: amidohydrolase [Phycisphaerales bacterium]|nr:MAG: amidohydrolase [Phycisphaerales bacterium]